MLSVHLDPSSCEVQDVCAACAGGCGNRLEPAGALPEHEPHEQPLIRSKCSCISSPSVEASVAGSVDGATTLSGRSGMRTPKRRRTSSHGSCLESCHAGLVQQESRKRVCSARTSFGSLASLASLASSNSATAARTARTASLSSLPSVAFRAKGSPAVGPLVPLAMELEPAYAGAQVEPIQWQSELLEARPGRFFYHESLSSKSHLWQPRLRQTKSF